jgi:riboflavin synthase
MFTGIVEAVAPVVSLSPQAAAWRMELEAPEAIVASLGIGDSLACNGCCLTLVEKSANRLSFDLLEASLKLTNFQQDFDRKTKINLERSLAANGRLGGHFVTGHIDTQGMIEVVETRGKNVYLQVGVAAQFAHLLVSKGSVSIDGISLTTAEVSDSGFAVWLIPHTLEVTNLGQREAGQSVNLEFDLLAKYAERLMAYKR